jgi:hypothetical protein
MVNYIHHLTMATPGADKQTLNNQSDTHLRDIARKLNIKLGYSSRDKDRIFTSYEKPYLIDMIRAKRMLVKERGKEGNRQEGVLMSNQSEIEANEGVQVKTEGKVKENVQTDKDNEVTTKINRAKREIKATLAKMKDPSKEEQGKVITGVLKSNDVEPNMMTGFLEDIAGRLVDPRIPEGLQKVREFESEDPEAAAKLRNILYKHLSRMTSDTISRSSVMTLLNGLNIAPPKHLIEVLSKEVLSRSPDLLAGYIASQYYDIKETDLPPVQIEEIDEKDNDFTFEADGKDNTESASQEPEVAQPVQAQPSESKFQPELKQTTMSAPVPPQAPAPPAAPAAAPVVVPPAFDTTLQPRADPSIEKPEAHYEDLRPELKMADSNGLLILNSKEAEADEERIFQEFDQREHTKKIKTTKNLNVEQGEEFKFDPSLHDVNVFETQNALFDIMRHNTGSTDTTRMKGVHVAAMSKIQDPWARRIAPNHHRRRKYGTRYQNRLHDPLFRQKPRNIQTTNEMKGDNVYEQLLFDSVFESTRSVLHSMNFDAQRPYPWNNPRHTNQEPSRMYPDLHTKPGVEDIPRRDYRQFYEDAMRYHNDPPVRY